MPNGVIKQADFKYDIFSGLLEALAPNKSEQTSRSGLCKRVIRREATETEGLVLDTYMRYNRDNRNEQRQINIDIVDRKMFELLCIPD